MSDLLEVNQDQARILNRKGVKIRYYADLSPKQTGEREYPEGVTRNVTRRNFSQQVMLPEGELFTYRPDSIAGEVYAELTGQYVQGSPFDKQEAARLMIGEFSGRYSEQQIRSAFALMIKQGAMEYATE